MPQRLVLRQVERVVEDGEQRLRPVVVLGGEPLEAGVELVEGLAHAGGDRTGVAERLVPHR